MADTIAGLLAARQGHFRMESGYHSASWSDLRTLFEDARRMRPFVAQLASRIAAHRPEAICGPVTGGAELAELVATDLGIDHFTAERMEPADATGMFPVRYALPQTERSRARGRAVAIVDDAISAGSAVRGTYADLIDCGARPVAIGALVVFGDAAADLARRWRVALEAVERLPLDMWTPSECPLCRTGIALERAPADSA